MEDYAGRVLADRYRLPLPPTDEYELAESRAWDTYSGQEVLVRQVPLPEVVEAEVLDADGLPDGFVARDTGVRDGGVRRPSARTTRRPTEPAVRRAIEAAQAAAQIPDHPRLDQVFDVFAEGGSLWIVSELVPARQLAALLAEGPLSPYRAAEVASDVLTALRVLHAHGWVHRNITARTVLVCDDGRVMLTGLASGAAEEALCGYDPVPAPEGDGGTGRQGGPGTPDGPPAQAGHAGHAGQAGPGGAGGSAGQVGRPGGAVGQLGQSGTPGRAVGQAVPGARGLDGGRGAVEAVRGGGGTGALPVPQAHAQTHAQAQTQAQGRTQSQSQAHASDMAQRALDAGGDVRAARAGAIAAYRAGARAAARVQEEQRGGGNAALPAPRSLPGGSDAEAGGQASGPISGRIAGQGAEHTSPPGQIADPYGVGGAGLPPGAWHGAAPRGGAPAVGSPGQIRPPALPDGRTGGHGGDGGTGAIGGTGGAGGTGRTTDGRGTEAVAYGAGYAPSADHTSAAPGTGAGLEPGTGGAPAQWSQPASAAAATRRGPATALAAERARQARMAVVGPVTERWAPEQAGPVHENWQLAAPIGPATDLWALGALLFRAVQGHAPYPEESTAELVQLVCAEPPAFAEECGPLRPVVESLLRQDPTERLDFEELRGWLRSLVRSAPEPEAGTFVIAAPPVDPARLPVVRRRGELVRRRRAGLPATTPHGRHKRGKQGKEAKPRRLGRTLLLLILLAMAAAVAYAVAFMPKTGSGGERTGSAGDVVAPTPGHSGDTGAGSDGKASSGPQGEKSPGGKSSPSPTRSSSSTTQTTGPDLPQGFTLRKDSEGFRVAVANGWERTGKNGRGQVVYSHGKFELLVVPGRDTTEEFGSDPMSYQREDERELQPFRDSTWATSSGMRRIDVGGRAMAEGQFTWQDSTGSEVYVRNLVIIDGGKYHVVQLRGPEAERDEVTRLYEQASSTYQITG
ncbi:protein kinase [Streptomyces sp. BH-SS-21]|uniref:Protein kinase n=1 Tax=Streptomyces liliiviolaceus TaxID=2823109 RepID=A0A940XSA1_9ACTN|nr:protein kinase [Streptomyces liliiviolaceus]MBQ0847012.1 protein kinase [Streptomyces liliiviolaceus]